MSHVVTPKTVITDLAILKKAAGKFSKLQWLPDRKTFNWYKAGWQNDYNNADAAYLNGIPVEDYGKCEVCIRMPGVEYEIGVVKRRDGAGYSLVWDMFGCGKQISHYLGNAAELLMKEYNQEYLLHHAQQNGMMTNVTENDEEVQVEMFT